MRCRVKRMADLHMRGVDAFFNFGAEDMSASINIVKLEDGLLILRDLRAIKKEMNIVTSYVL